MSKKIWVALTGGALVLSAGFATAAAAQTMPAARAATTADTTASTGAAHQPKPTIVLVSGAFEDSTSWSGEITKLENAATR